jgi:ribA/ribD-fused uncharacterized protein
MENYKLDTDTHVFFYEQDFYVLSNFSSFRVIVDGIDFMTREHAYHYYKFNETNPKVALEIVHARSAHDAFKIAEKNKATRRSDWDAVKTAVMKVILIAKVEQNEYVKKKLLATGDRILVEDSWRDSVWGWGADKNGQNLLGNIWMDIRRELRNK